MFEQEVSQDESHYQTLHERLASRDKVGIVAALYAGAIVLELGLVKIAGMSDNEIGALTAGETIAAFAAGALVYATRKQ